MLQLLKMLQYTISTMAVFVATTFDFGFMDDFFITNEVDSTNISNDKSVDESTEYDEGNEKVCVFRLFPENELNDPTIRIKIYIDAKDILPSDIRCL